MFSCMQYGFAMRIVCNNCIVSFKNRLLCQLAQGVFFLLCSGKPVWHCSKRVLLENRPALYYCNYKENKKNNIRMLDTLFTEDFIDSMEQWFHFYNHNWQWNSVAQTKDLKQYLWYGIIKIYFIGRNKCIIKKIECWPVFKQDPSKLSQIWACSSVLAISVAPLALVQVFGPKGGGGGLKKKQPIRSSWAHVSS